MSSVTVLIQVMRRFLRRKYDESRDSALRHVLIPIAGSAQSEERIYLSFSLWLLATLAVTSVDVETSTFTVNSVALPSRAQLS